MAETALTALDGGAPADEAAGYTVFRGADAGWVLRDHATATDYPFHSHDAAVRAIQGRRLMPHGYIGSPSAASVYGEPLEGVERHPA